MAAHLKSLERQTGRVFQVSADEVPDVPWPVAHVWEWFVAELSPRRSSSGFGANPLSFADIEAWARLTGRRPTSFEARLLMQLDDAMVHALRPKSS